MDSEDTGSFREEFLPLMLLRLEKVLRQYAVVYMGGQHSSEDCRATQRHLRDSIGLKMFKIHLYNVPVVQTYINKVINH